MQTEQSKNFTLGGFAIFASILMAESGITVAAPIWSASPVTLVSTQLPNANGKSLNAQQVVINEQGQVVSAWVRGTNIIHAKVRLNGKWGAAATLVPAAPG